MLIEEEGGRLPRVRLGYVWFCSRFRHAPGITEDKFTILLP